MDVVGPTAVEEVVASLMPATEVAGAMEAVAGVMAAAGAMEAVPGVMAVVVFLGIGEIQSHSSPDQSRSPI